MPSRGKNKSNNRRRGPPKQTEELPSLPLATESSVAYAQRAFCKRIIEVLLSDNISLSFSAPVDQLWAPEILQGYFDIIKNPMDLGTVLDTVSSHICYVNCETGFFDANYFRYEARLVFLNALEYNPKGSTLARYAAKLLNLLDSKLANLPFPETAGDREAQTPENPNVVAVPRHEEDAVEPEPVRVASCIDVTANDPEVQGLNSVLETLFEKRSYLAKTESMKKLPLTLEENTSLRDEVQKLPWSEAEKVAKILHVYIREAVSKSKEKDPEFVSIDFSTVEPLRLREIQAVVWPNAAKEEVPKEVVVVDQQILELKRKLEQAKKDCRKRLRRS